MRDLFESQRQTLHREAWDLLPWLVNGSLSDAQAHRVQKHLSQCSDCEREYRIQESLRQQMQCDESVVYAPHASLRKLMARIDQDDTAPTEVPDKVAPVSHRGRTRWLAAAVVVQTVGLIGLAGTLSWKLNEAREAPRYSTLSSTPTVLPQGPAARVVFSPSLPLADLEALLRSHEAQIVAGPSEAGVYTLMFPAARNPTDVSAAIKQLRSHPQVRFAELAVADSGAPR